MKRDKLLQMINDLKEYQHNQKNPIVSEVIQLLQTDIDTHITKWNKTLKEIAKVITHYQPIANNHNCNLKYSIFSIADINYLDVYLNKNGYKCTVMEASENSNYNIEIKLARILESELIELASKIDNLVH